MSDLGYELSFEDRVAVRGLTEKRIEKPQRPSSDAAMLACTLSEWDGDPAHCRWCNDENPTSAHRWCCKACVLDYKRNHWWKEAKQAAMHSAWRKCADCADDPVDRPGLLEVHHSVPVIGQRGASCLHHLDGLVVLCQHHHGLRHHPAVSA